MFLFKHKSYKKAIPFLCYTEITMVGNNEWLTEEFIKTEREAFRAQATDALKRFSPTDREQAVRFETGRTTANDVLRAWAEQIQPIHTDLEQKRDDAKLKKSLMKAFGFSDQQADNAVDHLIDTRKSLLLDEVLSNLYPRVNGETPMQRQYAETFLLQSESSIDDFFSRYIDFMRATEAAEKYHVALCDPHGSWLERQRAAMQVNKERQRTEQDEDGRLEEVEEQLAAITKDPDNLVGKIIEKQWDFVTVLDLRAKYQKHVDALSARDSKSPSKRLKLFERVTQSFRDTQAEKLAAAHRAHSLMALRQINESIYDLLLEIFDLNPTRRNKLLLDIQKHTRLSQERDLILLIQRNREHFLTKHQ
jgi:hypothetical protein